MRHASPRAGYGRAVVLVLALLLWAAGTVGAQTGNIDATNKYAWAENTGWTNYRPTGGGVTVYPDHLEGFAWAENTGWLKLGSHVGGGAHTYLNTTATDWGVNRNGSVLSGYAWSENTGWVRFDPTGGGVTLDPATGDFDGYAWGENTGWIHFRNASPAYKVSFCEGPFLAAGPTGTAVCSGGTANLGVTATGTGTLHYAWYQGASGDTGTPAPGGADAPGYTTPGLTADTSYWCRVSNGCGTSDTGAATVTVVPLPVPTVTGPATVCAGSSVTLDAGDGYASYSWAPGGATTRTVDVSPATDTTYTVTVTNGSGCAGTSAGHLVTVVAATSVTGHPASQTVASGDAATFAVGATGVNLHYAWYRGVTGDVSMPVGADADAYTTPALTDSVPYWVRVTGNCGTADSATGWVTVRQAVTGAPYDLDGDGYTDVIWRNDGNETLTAWLWGEGGAVTGRFLGTVGSTDWQVKGVADFDGNGLDDVLWRDAVTGAMSMWLMGPAGVLSSPSPGTVDPAWAVQGTDDMDGDGKADLLWRNDTLGVVSLWKMNGWTPTGSVLLGEIGTTDWQVIGMGDFNGDGKADLFWRKVTDGTMSVWLLDAGGYAGSLYLGMVDPAWRIVGFGDVDHDGCADVFWRHGTSGALSAWRVSGLGFLGAAYLGTVGDPNWKVVGVGDFNHDAKADLLWRYGTTGSVAAWYLTEWGLAGAMSPGSAGLVWVTQNHVNLNGFPPGGGKMDLDAVPDAAEGAADLEAVPLPASSGPEGDPSPWPDMTLPE
ncbi:MAG: VCBS repeat-containing protein [Acidobacteria bacterium]|nr:VCBS repeat-containing protein [Acidobacteriota bacterium]